MKGAIHIFSWYKYLFFYLQTSVWYRAVVWSTSVPSRVLFCKKSKKKQWRPWTLLTFQRKISATKPNKQKKVMAITTSSCLLFFAIFFCIFLHLHRQTDRRTYTQRQTTDKRTHRDRRQTNAHRETDRQTNRGTHRDRRTYRDRRQTKKLQTHTQRQTDRRT